MNDQETNAHRCAQLWPAALQLSDSDSQAFVSVVWPVARVALTAKNHTMVHAAVQARF